MRPPYQSYPPPHRCGRSTDVEEGKGSGMKWRLLFALIGLSITGITSFAERPPGAEGVASTRSSPSDAGFFSGTGVVRFQLVQGRLALDAPRHRKGSQSCQDGDIYQSITVTAERGLPSLHYVCQSPQQHLTLSVKNADTVRIESWLPESSERSIIEHAADGEVVWTIRRGEETQSQAASTLLHLRKQDERVFDNHFGELITRILQGTSLKLLGNQVHAAMLAETSKETVPFSTADVSRCVDGLRSPRHHVRAMSQRALLSWGTPVIAALDAVATQDLDAEQRHRIKRIRDQLRSKAPDTPAGLAKLLVNDPKYWASISDDLQSTDRRLAETHLQRVGFAVSLDTPDRETRIATK